MRISIITVNYNNLDGLKETFQSVVNQKFQEFEYIVIDGGSTDGSKSFLERTNQKIDYWVSEPDKGVYQAMNKGIKMAKGNFVLFLNSGDHFYSNDSLSYFEPVFTKPNIPDIIYGNIAVVNKEERIKTYPSTLSLSYFVEETLPHPASLIKRSCFDGNRYDERLKITSDWKFFMVGICKKKYTYQYINETISVFYIGGMSSNVLGIISEEKNKILKEEYYWYITMRNFKQTLLSRLRKFLSLTSFNKTTNN